MDRRLRACLRCGNNPDISIFNGHYSIECKCGLSILGVNYEQDLINAWNKFNAEHTKEDIARNVEETDYEN